MNSIISLADVFVCLGGLLTTGLLGYLTVAFSRRRGPFASRDSEITVPRAERALAQQGLQPAYQEVKMTEPIGQPEEDLRRNNSLPGKQTGATIPQADKEEDRKP